MVCKFALLRLRSLIAIVGYVSSPNFNGIFERATAHALFAYQMRVSSVSDGTACKSKLNAVWFLSRVLAVTS